MADSKTDFAEHEKTYDRFMKLTKYSIIATVILLVVLYVVINP